MTIIRLCGQVLKISAPVIAADTIDYLEMAVEMSLDWTRMDSVLVRFELGETLIEAAVIDGRINKSQHINLERGVWRVSAAGLRIEDGQTVERITSTTASLTVHRTGGDGTIPPTPVEPSIVETILAEAESAKTIAAAVQKRADEGEFDGAPGTPGAPGADGYSTTAKVERTSDGALITITDKSGTTTAAVYDGQGGGGGGSEILVATYGVTTHAEVKAAIDAGKTVVCHSESLWMPLVRESLSGAYDFVAADQPLKLYHIATLNTSGWSFVQKTMPANVTSDTVRNWGFAEQSDVDAVKGELENKLDKGGEYLVPTDIEFSVQGFVGKTGGDGANVNAKRTDYIEIPNDIDHFELSVYTTSSVSAYAFYAGANTAAFISGATAIIGDAVINKADIPQNAKYVRASSYINQGIVPSLKMVEKIVVDSPVDIALQARAIATEIAYGNGIKKIARDIYFSNDGYITPTGAPNTVTGYKNTVVIPYVDGMTIKLINVSVGATPKAIAFYSASNGTGLLGVIDRVSGDYTVDPLLIPEGTKSFRCSTQVLTGEQKVHIEYEKQMRIYNNVLDDSNVLIFGDSITDCCQITIDENNCTKTYAFRSPSNQYTDADGNTVTYDMWAKILKDTENCAEIRNYAKAGASWKSAVRASGEERQNLHYQIDVALNDVPNPNGVFGYKSFAPDIIIFALGTNDGATPNDSYETAMATSVETLDESKFNESVRKAFARVKNAFPTAQIFVVLPIQRVSYDMMSCKMRSDLKQMAQRYGCIIIDGTTEFGITSDNEVDGGVGVYLKDGLHPNDKGQKLMARGIISALKSHYSKI